jgi:hypothetical protein
MSQKAVEAHRAPWQSTLSPFAIELVTGVLHRHEARICVRLEVLREEPREASSVTRLFGSARVVGWLNVTTLLGRLFVRTAVPCMRYAACYAAGPIGRIFYPKT